MFSVPQVRMILTVGLLIMNLFSFSLYLWDRACKRNHIHRVPNFLLYTVALLGGGLGASIAVFFFRCKRRRPYFKYIILCFLILQIAALAILTMGL